MGGGNTLADPEAGPIDDIVDTERYPLACPESDAWRSLVEHVRSELTTTGSASLPGFVGRDALDETGRLLSVASQHVPIRRQCASVYHRADLEVGCRRDDPRRIELEWFAGHVTRDMIPPYASAHRLYVSPFFKRFVAACVGERTVFEYADPLAGLVATIVPPGGRYPWHYDTNEFVVTIMIRPADRGGRFEYVKDLRCPGDENLAGLGRVLRGDERSAVRTVDAAAGDLQLFRGRYSLHQVTEVLGDRPRHVLVLSYADRPGVIGPLDRTRSVYGRVTEAHLVAAQQSCAESDHLIL